MTTAYAASKTVHGALKRALSPWFLANGWKRRAGYSCAFLHEQTPGYWCLSVQVSAWGGRLWGNSFTLNLERVKSADAPFGAGERVLQTLTAADKRIGFSIAEELATRIPDPVPSDPVYEWAKLPGYEGESWRKKLADIRKANPDSWKPRIDVWLHYYSVEDLDMWVEFLLPRLPHLLRPAQTPPGKSLKSKRGR